MELMSGAEELQIRVDRASIARYGINVSDIQEMIETLYGSRQLSEMLLGEERFPIAVRLPLQFRNNPENLRSLQIKTHKGELVRLDQLAEYARCAGRSSSTVQTRVAGPLSCRTSKAAILAAL